MPTRFARGGGGGGGGLHFRDPADVFANAAARTAAFGSGGTLAGEHTQFAADRSLAIIIGTIASPTAFQTYTGDGGTYDDSLWLDRTDAVQGRTGPGGSDGTDGTDGAPGGGAIELIGAETGTYSADTWEGNVHDYPDTATYVWFGVRVNDSLELVWLLLDELVGSDGPTAAAVSDAIGTGTDDFREFEIPAGAGLATGQKIRLGQTSSGGILHGFDLDEAADVRLEWYQYASSAVDQSDIDAARAAAEAAQTAAEVAEAAAETAETGAETAESNASSSASAAAASATAAAASAAEAQGQHDVAAGSPRGALIATSPTLSTGSVGSTTIRTFGDTEAWSVEDDVPTGFEAGSGAENERLSTPNLHPAGSNGLWIVCEVDGVEISESMVPWGGPTFAPTPGQTLVTLAAATAGAVNLRSNVRWIPRLADTRPYIIIHGAGTTLPADTVIKIYLAVVRGEQGEDGDGGTGTTDLAVENRGATTLDVTSSTGANATLPAASTTEAGLQTAADKTKLDGTNKTFFVDGDPAASDGAVGDSAIDYTGGRILEKTASDTWTVRFTMESSGEHGGGHTRYFGWVTTRAVTTADISAASSVESDDGQFPAITENGYPFIAVPADPGAPDHIYLFGDFDTDEINTFEQLSDTVGDGDGDAHVVLLGIDQQVGTAWSESAVALRYD